MRIKNQCMNKVQFNELPLETQDQITELLLANNFIEAKRVYEQVQFSLPGEILS